MTAISIERTRKSEKLEIGEWRALVKWVDAQPTKFDAAILLDLSRPTLDRILSVKSGSPESIRKIREILPKDAGKESAAKI